LLHNWCERAEIRNLSAVGFGAYQLHERFRSEVIENPRIPVGNRDVELWLMYHGGMNSVGNPTLTNRYIRSTFALAHRRNMSVVGLTLTPWGSEDDEERWAGSHALHSMRNTRKIVDFVLGRLLPRDALADMIDTREVAADQPWLPSELPDVAIDLYDSRLRDRDARPRPVDAMERALSHDSRWRRSVSELDDGARAERLAQDARALSEAPRWYLRREYRGFDHVHPNRDGHRVIAETVCPRLPQSWGCHCPSAAGE
jgi:hypothetical protein